MNLCCFYSLADLRLCSVRSS